MTAEVPSLPPVVAAAPGERDAHDTNRYKMLATMMASAILRSPPLFSNHINQPGGIRMCVNTAPTKVPAVAMTEVQARQLADMIGVSNAKRIMRFCPRSCQPDALLSSIPRLRDEYGISNDDLVAFMCSSVAVRLHDEAFWTGLSRLKEFDISGDRLVGFMSNSVAAKLDDEEFWVGLSRLDEFGISGDQLVTFMGGSVATRLDDDEFMEGLSSLCSELSPPVVVDLLKSNNPFASRVTTKFARSFLNITRHLDSHGYDGARTLKALIGKTPLVRKVAALETILLSADSPEGIEAKLKLFRGSYAHKSAIAATL